MIKAPSTSFFDRMRIVPDKYPGIYFLSAGFHKRMSTFVQQNRAISLCGTLLSEHIKSDTRVAVVGAGAAGLSLANMLAWQTPDNIEIKITVFEQQDQALTIYQDSNRLIDCRLYEWPLTGWQVPNGKAALPLLSWSSGRGRDVTDQLRKQWDAWKILLGNDRSYYKRIIFKPNHNVTLITPEKGNKQWTITAQSRIPDETPGTFDIVVLATGPTPLADPTIDYEIDHPIETWRWDYWSNEEPKDRPLAGHRVLIFGRGDSALTRALEVGFEWRHEQEWHRFDQQYLRAFIEKLRLQLGPMTVDAFCGRVQKIEHDLDVSLQKNKKARSEAEMHAWEALQSEGKEAFDGLVSDGFIRQRHLSFNSSQPIEIFLAYQGKENCIDGKAFTLHRWSFAQLCRREWVRLIPNSDVRCLQQITGKWCIRSQQFDEVYFGVPKPQEKSEPRKYTPEFWMKMFLASLQKRNLDRGRGSMEVVDKRELPRGDTSKQRFFSDLFDSSTQDDVFQTLKLIFDEKKAEDWLLNLYEDRLLLELQRRDYVVLNDDQLVEGAFFLRWLPQERAKHFFCSKRLIARRRMLDGNSAKWSDVCDRLFSSFSESTNTYMATNGMVFSGIDDKNARVEVNTVLENLNKSDSTFADLDSVECAVKKLLQPASRDSWEKLRLGHKHVANALNSFGVKTEDYGRQLNFLRNTEDLAAFASLDMDHLRELGQILNRKEHPAQRKNKYSHFNDLRKKKKVTLADGIKHFYDRSVLRAFAEQHNATVFETIRVERLPLYTNRPRKDPLSTSEECSRPKRNGKTVSVDLRQLDGKCLYRMERGNGIPPYEELREEQPVGCAALDVLIGCSPIERRWIEEAQKQGPRTPAMIDEEKFDKKLICRVEYRDEIG